MNDSRIHQDMKIARNDSTVNSAAETDVAFHSTHRKGFRRKLFFSTRRVVDLIPEACYTAMTEDRHDELAATDLSIIVVALTPS